MASSDKSLFSISSASSSSNSELDFVKKLSFGPLADDLSLADTHVRALYPGYPLEPATGAVDEPSTARARHQLEGAAGAGAGAGAGAWVTVEVTEDGNLRIDAAVARRFFPADALVAVPRGRELWLMPLTGPQGGGLLLKQRNPAGDRSTLIWEALPPDAPSGLRDAVWDDTNGALRVDLATPKHSPP